MRMYVEMSLTSMQWWSGAKDNAARLTYSELEQLEYILTDIYGEEGVSETTVNDIMWFDFDWVCECLGYKYDVENDEIIRDIEEEEEDI